MGRNTESEEAAARNVVRVLGGSFEINDTGSAPGQFDVLVTDGDGKRIALEVTSFGGDDWKRTRARVREEQEKDGYMGDSLSKQWWVVFRSGISVRELQPKLEELLARLENEGHDAVNAFYEGDDTTLAEIAAELKKLQVNSAQVWDEEPAESDPRILLSQSASRIGTAGSLGSALEQVFAKGDNQKKLAKADVDARHLYVFMEDGGVSAVIEGMWPLPACPPDPEGVIDTIWLYSPSLSAYLFRGQPGEDAWKRYVAADGSER